MGIVLKWNFKNLLADIPRLVLTLLSVTGTFAMLIAMGLTVESHMLSLGSMNEGLPKVVLSLLRPAALAVFAVTLYVFFAVSLAERKDRYFLMRSSGMTSRQLLYSLLTESVALDAAGAVPGVGLGFLIAWVQLRSSGIPLRPDIFWSRPVLLYSILPALVLPPLMMLVAFPQLLRQKRGGRRKKPPKKEKPPLRAWLLPRLFGMGGALEYALGRRQRRHRALLVASIVVDFAVLFLMTAGLGVLTRMESITKCDMEIRFSGSAEDAAGPQVDGEGFRAGLDTLLAEGRTEGLVQSVERVRSYEFFSCVMEDSTLSPETLAAYDADGENTGFTDLLRLNGSSHVNSTIDLYVLDDAFFDRLTEEERRLTYTGSGAVLYNRCSVKGNKLPLMDEIPSSGVTLYPTVGEYYDVYWDAIFENALSLPETAEALLKSGENGVALSVGGLLNAWWGNTPLLRQNNIALLESSVLLPERQLAQYAGLLDAVGGDYSDRYYIRAADTDALYRRMTESLGGYGFTIRRYTLGDGKEFQNPSSRSTEEQSRLWNTSADVYDYAKEQHDFRVFLTLVEWLYRFFAAALLVMIALSMVNVVHMNRVSRRREYAILTSVGISSSQRRGMMLYESFRIAALSVVSSVLLLVPTAWFGALKLIGILTYENLTITGFESVESGYGVNPFSNVLEAIKALLIALKPNLWLVIFALLFLFFGFVAAELLVHRRFEKEDLIEVLKDDLFE